MVGLMLILLLEEAKTLEESLFSYQFEFMYQRELNDSKANTTKIVPDLIFQNIPYLSFLGSSY